MIWSMAVRSTVGDLEVASPDIFDGCLLNDYYIMGDIYHDFIFAVTGLSLSENELSPKEIEIMANIVHDSISDDMELPVEEQLGIAQWLKVCCNHGLGIINIVQG